MKVMKSTYRLAKRFGRLLSLNPGVVRELINDREER
jgi:hypothetical protein